MENQPQLVKETLIQIDVNESDAGFTFTFTESRHFLTQTALYNALRDVLQEVLGCQVMVRFASQATADWRLLSCPSTGEIYYDPMRQLREPLTVIRETGTYFLARSAFKPSYVRTRTSVLGNYQRETHDNHDTSST